MLCENCGLSISSDSLFCENCGAKQQPSKAVPANSPATPNKRMGVVLNNAWLVAIIAVLTIAVITLSVVLLTRPDDTQPESESENVSSALEEFNSAVQPDTNNTIQSDDVVQLCPAATNDHISYIDFSGALPPAGSRVYDGYQTVDGDADTCWIVNTNEPGAAGAWIEYRFDESCAVSGIKMINGNVYRDGYYFTNGHIKDFRLDFSDGTSKYFTASEIESRSVDSNVFYFDNTVITSYVRLTIISSYIGTKDAYRTNSAMAEFVVF